MDKIRYFKVGFFRQFRINKKFKTLRGLSQKTGISKATLRKIMAYNNSYYSTEKTRNKILKAYGMDFDEFVEEGRLWSAFGMLVVQDWQETERDGDFEYPELDEDEIKELYLKIADSVYDQVKGYEFIPTDKLKWGIVEAVYHEVLKFKITDEEIENVVVFFLELSIEIIGRLSHLYHCPPVKWVDLTLNLLEAECDKNGITASKDQVCWSAIYVWNYLSLDGMEDYEIIEDIKDEVKRYWNKGVDEWEENILEDWPIKSDIELFDCFRAQYYRRDEIPECELEKIFLNDVKTAQILAKIKGLGEDFILKTSKDFFLKNNSYSNINEAMVDRFIENYKKRND